MRQLLGGRRLALAAVGLYLVVALGVALPPTAGRVALLVMVGVALMVVGVQVIFGAFFLSILGLRRPPMASSTREARSSAP